MQAPARTAVVVTAVTVAVSFLTVCVPTASAQATASPSGPSPWAYGALASRSWTGASGADHFQASVTVGFANILHEKTGGGDLLALDVNRTMGLLLSVRFCLPSCQDPIDTASVAFHAWESIVAQVLLTTDGNVTVGSAPMLALAVVESNVSLAAGVTEVSATVLNNTEVAGHNLSLSFDANASSTFAPALGLVPLNPYAGESWNSSSVFNTTGQARWAVLEQFASGAPPVSAGTAFSLNATGAVLLQGSFPGATVGLGGGRYDVLHLGVSGPFALREGFLLIPTPSALFGPSAPAWLPSGVSLLGSANYSAESVDVASSLDSGSHVGFVASEISWTSTAGDPLTATLGGLAPAATAASPAAASESNTTTLQGEPESVAQATTDQGCLASGVGCPGAVGPRSLLPLVVVAGAIGVLTVLALVVIAERRRMPPPSYPNASLYPPGPATARTPTTGRRPAPATPPAEDDPLSHLW